MPAISDNTEQCAHCLHGRVDTFSGLPSTMVVVRDTQEYHTEECRVCGHIDHVTHTNKILKIKRNDAQGKRDQDMNHFWKDTLQPIGPDGRPNKLFEKTYGWSPNSEDPRVPKSPPWQKRQR